MSLHFILYIKGSGSLDDIPFRRQEETGRGGYDLALVFDNASNVYIHHLQRYESFVYAVSLVDRLTASIQVSLDTLGKPSLSGYGR